jgi:hypothetical protein
MDTHALAMIPFVTNFTFNHHAGFRIPTDAENISVGVAFRRIALFKYTPLAKRRERNTDGSLAFREGGSAVATSDRPSSRRALLPMHVILKRRSGYL